MKKIRKNNLSCLSFLNYSGFSELFRLYPVRKASSCLVILVAIRILLFKLNKINQERWNRFKANKRGVVSLWIFLTLFVLTLFSELLANDKPLLIRFDGKWFVPVFRQYSEIDFGGDFEVEADYRDPYVSDLIKEKGWILWPLIPYSYDTINYDLPSPAPSPPTKNNWLGTDDKGRDVLARLLYGFRISVLFGLTLTVISSIIGIIVGSVTVIGVTFEVTNHFATAHGRHEGHKRGFDQGFEAGKRECSKEVFLSRRERVLDYREGFKNFVEDLGRTDGG